MTLDLKNNYYFTPMIRYEYMKLPFAITPNEIIAQYNLKDEGGWVYIEIRQGMPGLKQSGLIANERLTRHLDKFGYTPSTKTPALWRHATRNISFSLVVNNFGVKYVDNKEEKFRTSVTVGGKRLPYLGPTSTKTTSMTTIKILLNITISTFP